MNDESEQCGRARTQPYVGKAVTNAFAGKVLKEARALAGQALSASKFKPLVEVVNQSGIGYLTVHTTNADEDCQGHKR